MMAGKHPEFREAIKKYREQQVKTALEHPDPRQ